MSSKFYSFCNCTIWIHCVFCWIIPTNTSKGKLAVHYRTLPLVQANKFRWLFSLTHYTPIAVILRKRSKIQTKCCLYFLHMIRGCNQAQSRKLVASSGIINPLCDLLNLPPLRYCHSHCKVWYIGCKCIHPAMVAQIKMYDGVQMLYTLKGHQNIEIGSAATEILLLNSAK